MGCLAGIEKYQNMVKGFLRILYRREGRSSGRIMDYNRLGHRALIQWRMGREKHGYHFGINTTHDRNERNHKRFGRLC